MSRAPESLDRFEDRGWATGAADDRLRLIEGVEGCCRVLRLAGADTELLDDVPEFR